MEYNSIKIWLTVASNQYALPNMINSLSNEIMVDFMESKGEIIRKLNRCLQIIKEQ